MSNKTVYGSSNKCANCGKEGSGVTNKCNKCNMVMYCNAACKKKHRHKHKKDCEEHVRRVTEITEGLRNNPNMFATTAVSSSAVTTSLNEEDIFPIVADSKRDNETWLRVSMFILGEELTTHKTPAGSHIGELLHKLLKTVKGGCCPNVEPGHICGHCESSISVIRISRAIILSICKLPLELHDETSRKELDRIRGWIYNQMPELTYKLGPHGADKMTLPPKIKDLIVRSKGTDCIDIQPPWEEDDFGILLQQPSPTWIGRVNILMLMGYRVTLVNFSDIARFSRKELKVVHDDISRLLCRPTGIRSDGEADERVAELNDQALFKEAPPEECPICFLRFPFLDTGSKYKTCCGKRLCNGCIFASKRVNGDVCPFCRVPAPTTEEEILQRTMKRMKLKDAQAIYQMACYYKQGRYGLAQDRAKALKLWSHAGELGDVLANYLIGNAYYFGRGVEKDEKKAVHYWEIAASDGHALSRYQLGCLEGNSGNMDRALKHLMIATKDGNLESLKSIKTLYSKGDAAKDDYEKALLLYQQYLDEIKSYTRDEAAAYDEKNYKYYQTT